MLSNISKYINMPSDRKTICDVILSQQRHIQTIDHLRNNRKLDYFPERQDTQWLNLYASKWLISHLADNIKDMISFF